MYIAVFSAKRYDRQFFERANQEYGFTLRFFEPHLTLDTARLAQGFEAVCAFTNDTLDRPVLEALSEQGCKVIAMRCAGYNNVDLDAVRDLGLQVVRVPAYSPHAVAEHAVAMILTLNRKTHRAYNRVRDANFALEGLLGFDLYGKTAGIVGTGKIGIAAAGILKGFGCRVLASDPHPDPECEALGVEYVPFIELCRQADIISLHCPLNPSTHHLVNAEAIERMKPGVMLINTSRGGTVDTEAVVQGLKSGKIGYVGLDVYEGEGDLFFEDLSSEVIQDDTFTRLLTFPNVLITGHQAFFTREAMQAIAETTLENIHQLMNGHPCPNCILPPEPAAVS